jgi:hypothetical protein
MWDEEQDFEIMDEVEEYSFNDETSSDFVYSELDPSADEDENENSDVFGYEDDFYNDDEEDY